VNKNAAQIDHAANLLRAGKLVAFPTETVYGLGADAQNEAAVARLFAVKGRPTWHPLIVHLPSSALLSQWAKHVPDVAWRLAEHFWPGPLTLVLPKADVVPAAVTGGQASIGLRVPDHPLALTLLQKFGSGVAAPSANRFGKVSPTTAQHVYHDLGDDVDFVLDGGPCKVGVESTVLSLLADEPQILRPGGVTQEELSAVLGRRVPVVAQSEVRSPGLLQSHYAPRAQLRLVPAEHMAEEIETLTATGKRVHLLTPDEIAAPNLFAALRAADDAGAEIILATLPHEKGLARAVADRLRKAAAERDN
jgi:L-threonylcarbamoyladenylate synthase